jgi:pSer/pThr/pTyr-binding forkhead associated (FHA) protein
MVVVEAGKSTTIAVQPGQRLIVGRDPGANVVLADPTVSPHHTMIERRGPGWLVSGLDASNPTWLLDPTGRAQPIDGELGLRSGELLIGDCQVMLYSPAG